MSIQQERERMIREGQDMSMHDAHVWLRFEAGLSMERAAATLQLVDALGERIVYIEAIRSPLVIKTDDRDPHAREHRYSVTI